MLKHGERFAVFDLHGDIRQTGLCEQGIYHEGTRYLSHLVFRLGTAQPFLLSSTVKRDNLLFTVDLTNPDVYAEDYAAKLAAASMATAIGHAELARDLHAQAEILKQRFNRGFWSDELATYAIALDRDKRRCEIKASNAGHCLFTGIATDEYAWRVAETLLSPGSFSGWGIRRLDTAEARYNPMSYHNGSVWPHDNGELRLGNSDWDGLD